MPKDLPLVKVAGTSAAGKSSLVRGLRARGMNARSAGQEHSRVPDMWQRLNPPQFLIFLEANLEAQRTRRLDVTWTQERLQMERERLSHARAHADLHIETSECPKHEVLNRALHFLRKRGFETGLPLPPRPRTGGTKPE